MAFTAQDVGKLREQTGAGMMDCKKALTHTDGDMTKAVAYLREQGISVAAKKADRLASEGAVAAFVDANGKMGAVVELNCETDFVAKNDDFVGLCNELAKHIANSQATNVEQLLEETHQSGVTVSAHITNCIAKIGEKISVRRFERFATDGHLGSYIHMGGKMGVVVAFDCDGNASGAEFDAMCHDVAMHIAAFRPSYVISEQVPTAELENEKEILRNQALNEGKPAQVVDKMVEGRVKKYYKDVCLVDQDFAKDPSITVGKYIDTVASKLGAKIVASRFVLYVMGEGLEKKTDNLAEEVAKMTQKEEPKQAAPAPKAAAAKKPAAKKPAEKKAPAKKPATKKK